MKAAWQGYIALGRLGIPVRLYSGTQSIGPKFVQLHMLDNSPVVRVLECKVEGHAIPYNEVVRGVEYTPGRYVTLTDRELERASPTPFKAITIHQFCDLSAVQPQYYDRPYYVVPGRGGERAYALMREVFVRTRKMAIAQVVMHGKEYLAALRVEGDLLMLLLMHYAAALVPRSSIKTPPLSKPSPAEIEVLCSVIEQFSGPFYVEDYHDERAERITDLVQRKAKGLPMRRPERAAPHSTPESEIIPALKDTLDERHMISGGND